MRRILFSLIIIIALLGNINIADAQYAHPGTAIKTNDGNVQSDIIGIKSDIAQSTAEIIALRANDQTQEIFINDNFNNLQTHETEIADITNEISLILANLGTIEIRLDSIEANILSMIQPAVDALILNLETLEALVNANFNELYANLQTHEIELATITNEINLLNVNLGTVEDRLNDISLNLTTIETELGSISVAINNLNLRLGAIELILAGGSSGEVFTRTSTGYIWATPSSGVTDHLLLSNIGTKTHAQLELDIAALQSNPAGISRVYVDGVALPTGEVEFVSGDNVTLNVSGSTVEVVATGGGGAVATVEITLNQDYTARAQGTAEAGFYSIYDFSVKYSDIVAGTIQPTVNGLSQYETDNFTIGTWDDGGTNRLRITFADDIAADALVRVSYCTTLPTFEGQATLEDIGVYVSDNKIWDFSDLYELNTIALLRNGIHQKRALYNTSIVSSKTRVTFVSAINTTDEIIIIGTPSSLQSTEDIATYVSDNTIWDFTDDFDPLKVYIYRNGVYQKRSLFTTSVVSNKLRVTFGSAINTTDEISLIYIQ